MSEKLGFIPFCFFGDPERGELGFSCSVSLSACDDVSGLGVRRGRRYRGCLFADFVTEGTFNLGIAS